MRAIRSWVFWESGQPTNFRLSSTPVDDQSAPRHGHRGDGVANVLRYTTLEVELLVLQAPEQAPELAGCEVPGDITEFRDGIHDKED